MATKWEGGGHFGIGRGLITGNGRCKRDRARLKRDSLGSGNSSRIGGGGGRGWDYRGGIENRSGDAGAGGGNEG